MTGIPAMPASVRRIIDETAATVGSNAQEMVGPRAFHRLAHARWRAWARIMDEVTINGREPSLPQVGVWFNRDHTTVLYGLRRLASDMTWVKRSRRNGPASHRHQLIADMAEMRS